MEEKIVIVLNEMSEYLSITQMKKLQEVIIKTFADNEANKVKISNEEFLKMFLDAKRIEGCSERTIIYYHFLLGIFLTFPIYLIQNIFALTNQTISVFHPTPFALQLLICRPD